MRVLPIVERELRVASRRRGAYWMRTGAAAGAILLFGLMFLLRTGEPSPEAGKELFIVLSVCFLGFSLLAGSVYTADSLSEEKREGTLGLLFLTDLKGRDVVLGKLTASSVGAVYAVLAILPVLGIPLLMGGVSGDEFGRLILVLVNTLFFSLAAGMVVSAAMRNGLGAMVVTACLVVAVNALPPLIAVWIAADAGAPVPPEALLVPSVGYAGTVAHEPLYKTRVTEFYTSLAVTHGLAWVFLLLASLRIRHTWHEGGGWWVSQQIRIRRWLRGGVEVQRRWRREAMDVNPCYWLGGRIWFKSWMVWVGLGLVGLLWLGGCLEWGRGWALEEAVALFTTLALHTLLRVWLAAEASDTLGVDRRSGALELLLCTPLSIRELVRGRLLALQRQFLWPSIVVVTIDLCYLAAILGKGLAGSDARVWIALYGCLFVVLMCDMTALAWLGMWWSLVCRRASRAFLRSVGLVLIAPWVLLVIGVVVAVVGSIEVPEPSWIYALTAYGTVSVGISFAGWLWARGRLVNRLRSIVAVPAETVLARGVIREPRGPSSRGARP